MGIDDENPTSQDFSWTVPGTNPDLKPVMPQLLGEKSWEAKKERVLPRELFELQLQCAVDIAAKTGQALEEVINYYTPFLWPEQWEKRESYDPSSFKPLPPVGRIVEEAYASYKKIISGEEVPYRNGDRFGCFSYDYNNPPAVKIHFSNTEFGDTSPLSEAKKEQRLKELADLFSQIHKAHPDATDVQGGSWLYNSSAYRELFPKEYTETREADGDPKSWQTGTKIWGQFLGSDYQIKQEAANQFLDKVKKIPRGADKDELPRQLLSALPYPPLKVRSPIDKFYKLYGIK